MAELRQAAWRDLKFWEGVAFELSLKNAPVVCLRQKLLLGQKNKTRSKYVQNGRTVTEVCGK